MCPCETAHYCSKDHQKRDWKEHRPICKQAETPDRDADDSARISTMKGLIDAVSEQTSINQLKFIINLTHQILNSYELSLSELKKIEHLTTEEAKQITRPDLVKCFTNRSYLAKMIADNQLAVNWIKARLAAPLSLLNRKFSQANNS